MRLRQYTRATLRVVSLGILVCKFYSYCAAYKAHLLQLLFQFCRDEEKEQQIFRNSQIRAEISPISLREGLPVDIQSVKMSRKRKSCPEPEVVCESWSKTEQYKVKGRHLWTIDDFMRRAQSTEVGESLCSPVFTVTVEGFDNEPTGLTFQVCPVMSGTLFSQVTQLFKCFYRSLNHPVGFSWVKIWNCANKGILIESC